MKVKFDGSFYLDKKKNPSEKANLLIFGDLTYAQKLVSVNGEAKFSHPSLQNDLSIKTRGAIGLEKRLIDATVDLDVFNKKNNKITASLKVDLEQNKNGHNVTGKLDFISKVGCKAILRLRRLLFKSLRALLKILRSFVRVWCWILVLMATYSAARMVLALELSFIM